MPTVLDGRLRIVPGQARVALDAVPVGLEVALDGVERLAAIGAVRVVAVLVRRIVVVPAVRVGVVRAGRVVRLPVVGVFGRVHGFGNGVAGLGTGDRAGNRTHRGADGAADGRTDRSAGQRARACTGTRTNRMIFLDVFHG